ncbi:hypothetical protein ACFYTF_29030 [Nocardia thailandica]|uniref:Transposase n=1 Tax=Nocardia thailandica TaxID=257275 RepID=A0ABW6PWS6_9NOCA
MTRYSLPVFRTMRQIEVTWPARDFAAAVGMAVRRRAVPTASPRDPQTRRSRGVLPVGTRHDRLAANPMDRVDTVAVPKMLPRPVPAPTSFGSWTGSTRVF